MNTRGHTRAELESLASEIVTGLKEESAWSQAKKAEMEALWETLCEMAYEYNVRAAKGERA